MISTLNTGSRIKLVQLIYVQFTYGKSSFTSDVEISGTAFNYSFICLTKRNNRTVAEYGGAETYRNIRAESVQYSVLAVWDQSEPQPL